MAAFVSAMDAAIPLRRSPSSTGGGRASATLVALATLAAAPLAQGKPDHVLWRNARGQMNTIVGTVSENSLAQVVIESGSTQRKIDSLSVERVDFGEVPQAYADAQAYLDRGDVENAAAKFSLAAGDSTARAVVRARARLSAAQAWLARGAADQAALATASKECEQFLAEFAANRDVPQARLLAGRVQRLSGDPAKAAETYAGLYREASGATPTAGYPPLVSFQAGLAAAEAYLAAKDVTKAREIYLGLDAAIGGALAQLGENDPARARFLAIQSEARLGEGYCLLAAGSLSQARTFFQGQLAGAEGKAAKRFGAQLGLAEVLLAEGSARAAQLEFAQVSAIDHTSEDRTARALVGLAESALKLDARSDAKLWLETVRTQHGGTPAALRAQELLQKL
jgi:thioredoxin-like negative regulator of GroEL